MNSKKNSYINYIAIFTIIIIFFGEFVNWEKNSYSFLFTHDAYTQTFPWIDLVLSSWRNSEIPLWTWGTNLGTSMIGELQPGTLYPPTIVLSIFHLGTILSINILIFTHAIVAGLGLYACGKFLKSNTILTFILSICWAYYLLTSRGHGQANLYYGYCYISAISALMLRSIIQERRVILYSKRIRFHIHNSIAIACLLSLSVLAGHTYATIAIIAFWFIFLAKYNFKRLSEKKLRFFNPGILPGIAGILSGFLAFILLSAGQIIATSEYFKLSRKWWGQGSTTYPHVVPDGVLRETGVSLNQIFNQFFLGRVSTDAAIESSLLTGINIITISMIILLIFFIILSAANSRKFNNKIELNSKANLQSWRVSNTLLFATMVLIFLCALSNFEIFQGDFLGARIYKSIPLINSIRLPGRIIPIIEFTIIITLLSYLSVFDRLKLSKPFRLPGNVFIAILALSLIFNTIVPLKFNLSELGKTGKLASTNPINLINSNCNSMFESIGKDYKGLVYLERRKLVNNFPKNMGDILNYPRFVTNSFRSSATLTSLSVDARALANIIEVDSKEISDISCVYENSMHFFQFNHQTKPSLFSSFISDPTPSKQTHSEMKIIVKNHSIEFPDKYHINSNNNVNNMPFIKSSYYPGWKAIDDKGMIHTLVNYNNFLGFPSSSKNANIVKIFYNPEWIFLVYLQLSAWVIVISAGFSRLLPFIKKI